MLSLSLSLSLCDSYMAAFVVDKIEEDPTTIFWKKL